jgi:hypothetical protein
MKTLNELFEALRPRHEAQEMVDMIVARKAAEPKESLSDIALQTEELETKLGMKHRPPSFNRGRATRYRDELAELVSKKAKALGEMLSVSTPPPAAKVEVPAAVVPTGPLSLDQQIAALGKTATGHPKASPAAIAKLEAEISTMPAGLTRECAEAKLKTLKA